MHSLLEYLKNQFKNLSASVGFFGLGKSNLALIDSLRDSSFSFTYRSDLPVSEDILKALPKGRLLVGSKAYDTPFEDIIFLSPSVRRDSAEFIRMRECGVIFSSDAEIFFIDRACTDFGVTGSDGKSTTAYLASLLLEGKCIGNFGVPFASVAEGDENSMLVAELSSFMLQYITPPLLRSVITNISENHLNWHRDYDEYKEAKYNILKQAKGIALPYELHKVPKSIGYEESVTLFSDTVSAKELSRLGCDSTVTVEDGMLSISGRAVFDLNKMKRKERYNIKNLLAAVALTLGYANCEKIVSVAKEFTGLPHRAEVISEAHGIKFINSSIDTTPTRTAVTLSTLSSPIHIILGGRSKGLSLLPLINAAKDRVISFSIYGEACCDFSLPLSELKIPIFEFSDFLSAVKNAASLAKSGETVLLSPAAVSYGEFRDFTERGDKFKEIINTYLK